MKVASSRNGKPIPSPTVPQRSEQELQDYFNAKMLETGAIKDVKYHCPTCDSLIDDPSATCWCFELIRASCQALAARCTCDSQSVMIRTSGECEHVDAVGIRLKDLTAQGFDFEQCLAAD